MLEIPESSYAVCTKSAATMQTYEETAPCIVARREQDVQVRLEALVLSSSLPTMTYTVSPLLSKIRCLLLASIIYHQS